MSIQTVLVPKCGYSQVAQEQISACMVGSKESFETLSYLKYLSHL